MSRDALVVGINDYHFMQPLNSPSADAEAVAAMLEQYGEFTVKRLPEAIDQETNKICVAQNNPLSLDELEKALVQLFKPTGSSVPDTALLFFSGHGLRRDLGIQEGFLSTSETGAGSGARGLSLQWLRRLILESEVRQQVILLDCCYSGELFNLTEADPGHLGRGRDRCFIAASREFELAYEETAGEHGVFTRALLDGLDPDRPLDGMVNNTELSDFISKQLTGTVQKPIFSNSGGAIILTRAVRPLPVPKKSKGTVCPYRGLSYFDCNEEDPKYFYGRAALTDQLIEKVRQSNFVAVLGPSGSGKSSVVRAGLLHQLKVGRKLSDSETWPVHMFRPGEHPLKSLAMAFVNSSLSNIEVAAQLDKAEELIAKGAVGLDRLVRGTLTSESSSKESSTNGRVVLVADQFEEVFSLCRDEKERDQFFKCLLGVLSLSPNSVCLILTMRADFLAKCAEREYSGLSALIQTNMVTVTPMTTDEFEQAIVKPAEKVGIAVESELIKTMVEDVKHSPGSLPLLQYTLTELWNRGEGVKFTLTEYSRMGGVKGSLARRADEVYEKELASDEERSVAKRIFIQLTQLGEGTEDTRRQILKQSLVKSPEEEQTVAKVIQTLADAKLIVTGEIRAKDEKKTRDAVVDVAHEALIRHWPKLRGWLDENREDIRFHRRLAEQARHWEEQDKPEGLLWRPPDLHLLHQFYSRSSVDMTATEVNFFKQSKLIEEGRQATTKSRVRNTKIALVLMLVLALIGGIASFVAFQQRDNAIVNQKKTEEAEAKAREQRDIAIISQKKAEEAEAKAREQRDIAKEKENDAEKQRKLAVARQLAAQATLSLTSPPTDFIKGTLLAAESLKQEQTLEGSRALTKALGLLPPKITRLKHEGNVRKLAFSPDGQQLATLMNFGVSAASGAFRIWDAKGDSLIAEVVHDGWITDVAFSSDGHLMGSAGWDHAIIVTNVITGEQVYRQVQDAPVFALAYSPDNQKLAIGLRDGKICIKAAEDGANILCMQHDAAVVDLAFTPNGDYLVTSSEDKTARVWDVKTGQEIHRFPHESKVKRMSLSLDGLLLATSVEMDAKAWVWDITSGQLKHKLTHDDAITDVALSPDGKWVIAGSWKKGARIWDAETGNEIKRLNIEDRIYRVEFSRDSTLVATVRPFGNDTIVRNIENPAVELLRATHNGHAISAAFNPDGTTLATLGEDETIRIWDLNTGEQLKQLKQRGNVNQVYFSPDGKRLVETLRWSKSDYSWGATVLWDSNTGKEIRRFGDHPRQMTDIVFSGDGKSLATGSYDRSARVWDLESGYETLRLNHKSPVRSVHFTLDGGGLGTTTNRQAVSWNMKTKAQLANVGELGGTRRLQVSQIGNRVATSGIDGKIRIWDATTGKGLRSYVSAGRFALSSDGRLLATVERSRETIKVIDLSTGQVYAKMRHDVAIDKFAFDRNGKSLAVLTKNRSIWLWDLYSGESHIKIVHSSKPQYSSVINFGFSPDGSLIATGGKIDGTVRIWDTTSGDLLHQFTNQKPFGWGIFHFSNDSRFLAAVHLFDKTVRIWDLRRNIIIHEFDLSKEGFAGGGKLVAIAPDGRRLALATGHGIQVRDVSSWKILFELSHDDTIKSTQFMAFSHDSATLATAGTDMTARLWDLSTGEELNRFQHYNWVEQIEFVAGGRILISRDLSGIARGWDIATGKELFRLAHGKTLIDAAFNRPGTHVVTYVKALAQVWDMSTGIKLAEFPHNGDVEITALSSDGRLLATRALDSELNTNKFIQVWDVHSEKELFKLVHDSRVNAMAFSADESTIATGSDDRTVRLWNAKTGKEIVRLTLDQGVKDVRLNPDQTLLAVVTDNESEVRVWDIPSRQEIARLLHDEKSVADIVFHPTKRIIATADGGETVRLLNLNSVQPEILRLDHEDTVFDVVISSDGKHLASQIGYAVHNYIPVWNLATGAKLYRVVHDEVIWDVALSPDSKFLATASSDKTVRTWNLASGHEVLRLKHNQNVHEVKFSPDGRWLATLIRGIVSGKSNAWEEHLLRIWKADSGHTMPLELSGYINNFAFSADGDRLATAEGAYIRKDDGSRQYQGDIGTKIWSVTTGKELLRLPHKYPVRFVAFSPNGKTIATLSTGFIGQPLQFWNSETGKLLYEINKQERDSINGLAFSPDWKFFALKTNRRSNEVQVWDLTAMQKKRGLFHEKHIGKFVFSSNGLYLATASGQGSENVLIWDWMQNRILTQIDPEESIYNMKFVPNDSRIITSGRSVKVWHWQAEDLVADACARLERNFTREEWRTYFGDETYRRTCSDLPEPEK